MKTRSSSRLVTNPSSNPTQSKNSNLKGRNRGCSKQRIEEFNLEELSPPIVTIADHRTMAQLLQAPTEGYEDAIVVPASLLITLSLSIFPNISNTLIKIMLFPFSLEGVAWIWLEHEPPRSIFTWDDLVLKFINQLFPPSKTTNLRNEITNFQQRFDESFSEAWDIFKDLLRACPHHGFSKLHQLDTFYNALNSKDQYSLNSAAGVKFFDKMPREWLAIIKSNSKVRYLRNKPVVSKVITNTSTSGISPDVAKLKDMVKALILDKKSQNQAPAIIKVVEESYLTKLLLIKLRLLKHKVFRRRIFNYVKDNNAGMRNMQTQGQNMQNQLTNLTELLTKFVNFNNASTSSSGTHSSNIIANPRIDLKAIITQSGVSYDRPQILHPPSFLTRVVENEPEATKDTVHPTSNRSTEDVQPPTPTCMTLELADRLISCLVGVAKDVDVKVGTFHFPADFVFVYFDADPRTSRYSANYNDMTAKRIDVIDMACEEYSQEVLGFSDVIASGNLTPYYDPIVSTTSPTLTPFKNSDFLLEEVDAFLAIKDNPTSLEVDQSYLDSEGTYFL
nr:hypothetical protein [Tanacetum cinerariifolium]